MRVHLLPSYSGKDQADGGIRRVVDAQVQYLHEFGIELVDNPDTADLCAVHGTLIPPRNDIPMVTHCHGMYWREYQWPAWGDAANRAVIDRILESDAVTAPSRWVANAISRGSLVKPTVIYHGVDTDEWQPGDNLGYVLWNKARMDSVSDPKAVNEVAGLLPSIPFVSTFGSPHDNVRRTGPMPVEAMRHVVARAGVYLATVRETFGIGTLEALSCGVPVVGWDFGGQSEIILEDVTGYLVPEGDHEALAHAIQRAIANRPRLSANARADAIERWQWIDRIAQYAKLYTDVYQAAHTPRPRTSVVITTYNLNKWLPEALSSAQEQADEVIIIDDHGTEIAQEAITGIAKSNVQLHRLPANVGLSGARNAGAALATGKYLLFLDADDMLSPGAVSRLSDALDRDRSLHIAAGRLELINEDGRGKRINQWPGEIDWRGQISHLNQLHYAAMWRRSAFDRTGGYRLRDWRAEDAALWTRVMSFGLRAKLVTTEPTLIYRMRSGSKSQVEAKSYQDRDGDWTRDYPWRVGNGTGPGGTAAYERNLRPHPWRVPFAAPDHAPGMRAWPVPHYQSPAVSVIIPVGPGHEPYLIDALDSLIAQDMDSWECIVVNDTGNPIETPGHPWVQHVQGLQMGAGSARNIGVAASKAALLCFLDADDMLTPSALRAMLERYAAGDVAFVYGDCAVIRDKFDLPEETPRAAEYSASHWLDRAIKQEPLGLPAVSMLIGRQTFTDIGGFDATMPAWEDGDLYLKLASHGFHGSRIDVVTLNYRITTGQRRKGGETMVGELHHLLSTRYKDTPMAKKSSCCGGNAPAVMAAAQAVMPPPDPEQPISLENLPTTGDVRMAYIGDLQGEHTVMGRPSNRAYRVGNNPFNKYFSADVRDVNYLISMGSFQLVAERQAVQV